MTKRRLLHVLIVEDCESEAACQSLLLVKAGFRVTLVDCTNAALDAFAKMRGGDFDIVLIDVNLGSHDVDGFDVVRYVRMNHPKTVPLLMSSESTLDLSSVELLDARFIAKPITPTQISQIKMHYAIVVSENDERSSKLAMETIFPPPTEAIFSLQQDNVRLMKVVDALASECGLNEPPAIDDHCEETKANTEMRLRRIAQLHCKVLNSRNASLQNALAAARQHISSMERALTTGHVDVHSRSRLLWDKAICSQRAVIQTLTPPTEVVVLVGDDGHALNVVTVQTKLHVSFGNTEDRNRFVEGMGVDPDTLCCPRQDWFKCAGCGVNMHVDCIASHCEVCAF